MAQPFPPETRRDPIDVLVDDPDPTTRSRAHVELGLRAKARDDLDMAEWHLREAMDLDPTDETTAEELRSIGKSVEPPPPAVKPKRFWGWMTGAMRRKN
jgi:hypothetical protein